MRKMLIVVFAFATLVFVPSQVRAQGEGSEPNEVTPPQAEQPVAPIIHLDGMFLCQGTMPDGTEYSIRVAIQPFGDSYTLKWFWPDNGQQVATGVGFYAKVGEELFLSAYYIADEGTPGTMFYSYNAEVGKWVGMGTTQTLGGTVYSEVLTWMPPNQGQLNKPPDKKDEPVPTPAKAPLPRGTFVA